MGKGWTPEREKQLLDLEDQGLSGTEIGLVMGITRNAAIAKITRLRGSKKNSGRRPKTKQTCPKKPPTKPKQGPKLNTPGPSRRSDPAKAQVEVASSTYDRLEVTNNCDMYGKDRCKWPEGCGKVRVQNSPYCPDHHKIAYRPVPPRKGTGFKLNPLRKY